MTRFLSCPGSCFSSSWVTEAHGDASAWISPGNTLLLSTLASPPLTHPKSSYLCFNLPLAPFYYQVALTSQEQCARPGLQFSFTSLLMCSRNTQGIGSVRTPAWLYQLQESASLFTRDNRSPFQARPASMVLTAASFIFWLYKGLIKLYLTCFHQLSV